VSSPDYSQDVKDIIDGLGDTPTPDQIYHAVKNYSVDHVVAATASTAKAGGGGGGGSQAVACVLARDAPFDIHDAGNYDILWDALYDDLWNLDPLAAIPDGLGLTFAFDGTSSLIVPTVNGIWSLSYFANRVADAAWAGTVRNGGLGLNFPWTQQLNAVGTDNGDPFLAATFTGPIPSGAQMTHQVSVITNAAGSPYTCYQVYLSIVRHA
jgi:hypothetical protein